MVIGQLGTIVLGFADTLMIGRHSIGELAAAGLVNNIFGLVFLFYLGFSYGLTPVVGRLYGMNSHETIGRKLKNSFVANMMVGIVLTAAMTVVFLNLAHMGQPEELLPLIKPYFMVNLASIPFVGVFNTLKQFFDGMMRTRVAMWIMVGANLVNILFNWLLIYGAWGFPELGLLGAGIATAGARVLMALTIFAVLAADRRCAVYRRAFRESRTNRADFAEMNRMGWPLALQLGMETAAFSLSCIMAGWLGSLPLAAHQIMITVSQIFYLVLSGLAAAVSIRISLYCGMRDFRAVRANAADGFRLILAIAAAMSIPTLIFRNHIGMVFTDNAEVQRMVGVLCIVLVAYQFGDALQYTFANALRGIACVKPMVYYAFLAYFVISLPLGYLLGIRLGMGITGIWLAFPFGLTLAGMLYLRKFRLQVAAMERQRADNEPNKTTAI